MPSAHPRQIVGAWCVRNGRLLVLQRTGGTSDGAWVPPGGQVDPGEAPEAAALRETLEETGLVLANPLYLRTWTWDSNPPAEVHHFVGALEGSSVRISNEHYDFDWLQPRDYIERHLRLPPGSRFEQWAREMRASAELVEAWIAAHPDI